MTDAPTDGKHLATKLRIGSRGSQLALWQAKQICKLPCRDDWTPKAKTKAGQNSSCFERIRKACAHTRSTLALLRWGFGEYYQCGYWAALENRGSRLFAAARGSNPLLSAAVRDPRTLGTLSGRNSLLTQMSSEGSLEVVLKRGPLPFLGGLTSRLSLLYDILPPVFHHV